MPTDVAHGSPTKGFFINMLTRDIELKDAILDLLDNCLDGVVRMHNGRDKNDSMFYDGYYAKIYIANDYFEIRDNCGGIKRGDVIDKAFRMGRDESIPKEDLATVGIYGIGMKRAIFKLGHEAEVITQYAGEALMVNITSAWANEKEDWNFPIYDLQDNMLAEDGTTIKVTALNSAILEQWKIDSQTGTFIDDLKSSIKACYSLIIEKGFKIFVNDDLISALPIQLLVNKGEGGIKPYIFEKEYGKVSVKLVLGFYISPPTEDEIDEGLELERSSSADAGWTVICNDRVVLYNDKSHFTGWGEADVPQYHTQFIGIKGIVMFESNDPRELPMTTTKRGIDLSSSLYAGVKNIMRDALKTFTTYTNRWKGQIKIEREEYSRKADKVPYTSFFGDDESFKQTYGLNYRTTNDSTSYRPDLPRPRNERRFSRISFSKSIDEIQLLNIFFYHDPDIRESASVIGEKCFDYVVQIAKKRDDSDA